MTTNIVMLVSAALIAFLMFQPRILRSPIWRAVVTPLASIIGSGFLVAGPILAHVAGNWAWIAMAGLCLLAYLFGAAIRHNIRYTEPLMQNNPPFLVTFLERNSDYALAFAYFISVAFYINLFASFGLKAFDIINPETVRYLSSAVIITLGLIGTLKGLRALEDVEIFSVSIKLALIGGLIAALAFAGITALNMGPLTLPIIHHATGLKEVTILLGLIILVQGFETSRYLGDSYDQETRIKTMKIAQILSTIIYVIFIILITPYFTDGMPSEGGETQIIDMLKPVGSLVAPLIIITALASQLSAAVADMNGAGGLVAGASNHRIPVKMGYFATAAVAVGITWAADIFDIIVYASKAFVFYYGLQCIIAAIVARQLNTPHKYLHMILFCIGAIFALAVLFFGVSVEV